MPMPKYKVIPEPELIYGSDAQFNTPFIETVIGIDRKNPASVDYTINNKNYSTHSNLVGVMIRTPYSPLVKKGYLVDFFIDNITTLTNSSNVQFTLDYDFSGAILVLEQEILDLDAGVWDIFGTITTTPPTQPNNTIYVMNIRSLQVVKP